MAHSHSHDHDENSYYLDQLFTIAVCGALGGVAVMLWYTDMLRFMLHPKFYIWVLAGGIALLALVAVRAIGLWFEVDQARPVIDPLHDHEHAHDHDHAHAHDHDHDHDCCGHDHAHEHDHGIKATTAPAVSSLPLAAPAVEPHSHDHACCGHDHDHSHGPGHDHGHSHGWSPWRYVVLILPVVLYFLNLPNGGFRAHAESVDAREIGDVKKVVSTDGPLNVGFLQLGQAALSEPGRERYEGKTIRLTGQYVGFDQTTCSLRRYKISCCAADAVPLDAVIKVDPNSAARLDNDRLRGQWVRVTGQVHFFPRNNGEYKTAIILYPTSDQPLDKLIEVVPPDPNPFLY